MLLASLLAPAAKEERVKVVGPNTTEPSSSDTIAKERCVACHAVVLEIERGMRRGRRSELALHDVFDEVCTQDRLDKFDLPPPRMVDLCLEIVSGWYDDGGVLKTLIAGGKREEAETFWPRLRDDVCISGSEYCRGQQFRPERHGEGLTWEGGLEKKLEDGGTNAVGFTGRKVRRPRAAYRPTTPPPAPLPSRRLPTRRHVRSA